MNKKRVYNIVYACMLFFVIFVLLIFPDLDDTLTLIIASIAIVLTSIFTYSNRRKK